MFGPVATSLPLTLIIKLMTSMGSHFHPRLMCSVNLICQIHSPQSQLPCSEEFCGTSKAQGLSAKSLSLGSPLPGNIPASGRPFPPALLLPVVPSALVSLFFLAGSGMMLEVELMWLLDSANSTPGACLSSCTACPLPPGF